MLKSFAGIAAICLVGLIGVAYVAAPLSEYSPPSSAGALSHGMSARELTTLVEGIDRELSLISASDTPSEVAAKIAHIRRRILIATLPNGSDRYPQR